MAIKTDIKFSINNAKTITISDAIICIRHFHDRPNSNDVMIMYDLYEDEKSTVRLNSETHVVRVKYDSDDYKNYLSQSVIEEDGMNHIKAAYLYLHSLPKFKDGIKV